MHACIQVNFVTCDVAQSFQVMRLLLTFKPITPSSAFFCQYFVSKYPAPALHPDKVHRNEQFVSMTIVKTKQDSQKAGKAR